MFPTYQTGAQPQMQMQMPGTTYQQPAQYQTAATAMQMPGLTNPMSTGTTSNVMQTTPSMMQTSGTTTSTTDPMQSFGMGAASAGMGTGMALNQMATAAGMAPAAMQAMYQQYALRWAAMQRFAAATQGMGMAGMGQMGMGQMAMPQMDGTAFGMGMGFGGQKSSTDGGKGMFWKTRLCHKWKEGLCTNAETCRYAHGEADLRGNSSQGMNQAGAGFGMGAMQRAAQPTMMQAQNKTQAIEAMKKTRLCQEFMNTGACKYGIKCTFAHGKHELRAPSNPAVGMRPMGMGMGGTTQMGPKKVEIHKTRLCQRFVQTGQCHFGNRCTFAHGEAELRTDSGKPVAGGEGGQMNQGTIGPAEQEEQQQQHQSVQQVSDAADVGSDAVGVKRARSDGVDDAALKRQHQEPEEEVPEPDCPYCAQLVQTGRKKVLEVIMGLENAQAKKLGCMVMAASNRIDQLWNKCTPTMLLDWLGKTQVSIMDKIDVLKTVVFHVHDDSVHPNQELVTKYIDMGLPKELADFVCMVMEGNEGTASMSEYFHMLEVAKVLFGVNDDNYYAVSTAVASIMMGM